MDLDKLNFLPEWQDDSFSLGESGDEWKLVPAREAAKALYTKWREIFGLVIAFAESLAETSDDDYKVESHAIMTQRFIYENAMIIAPKIMGAVGCGLYVLQMENAAIIRTNCRQMMEQIGVAVMMGFANEEHKEVIEDEVDALKTLFKNWVNTFQKDEYEDEWGLFI